MLSDAQHLSTGDVLVADVCIAGAGAAGITVARGLRDSGLKVVVLESGGLERSRETQDLYAGESTGALGNIELGQTRERRFGGTTAVWGGRCRPLQAIDFRKRDWLPHSGWPIGRDELEPHYRRAADTLDIGAHEWDAPAVAARNGEQLLPFGDTPVRTVPYQFSAPTRFGAKYRDELERADDVEVFLHANLVDVGLSPVGDRVEAFEARTLEGTSFRVEAEVYVLAMGGIENPRLLLASNDVRPRGVGNDEDQVGRYFMEHPRMMGISSVLVTPPDVPIDAYLGRRELVFRDADRPGGRTAFAMFALEVRPRTRDEEELLGLSVAFAEIDEARHASHLSGRDVGGALGLDRDGDRRTFLLGLRTEQPPVASSRVSITDRRDALGVPRPRLDWDDGDRYFDSVRRTLRIVGAALGRRGLGRLWMPTDEAGRYAPPFEGAHHHMGTTRMSRRPENGVVDGDCRVHGVANLYVAGSSVFATGGYGNPTLTIVALAHRLADHLRSRLERGRGR